MELAGNLAKRRTRLGKVVSDKMDKTVVVEVTSFRRHRIYKKMERRTERIKAHDEENRCIVGDEVRLAEWRPLSKDKRWMVVEVLTKGHGEVLLPAEIDSEIAGDEGPQ